MLHLSESEWKVLLTASAIMVGAILWVLYRWSKEGDDE